jgi:hypothetical protein
MPWVNMLAAYDSMVALLRVLRALRGDSSSILRGMFSMGTAKIFLPFWAIALSSYGALGFHILLNRYAVVHRLTSPATPDTLDPNGVAKRPRI